MKNVMRLCAVLCVMQLSSVAIGQDTNWTNAGGDAEWTNNLNWSSGATVVGTNFVVSGPTVNVTSAGVVANRVVLDNGGASDGTVYIAPGADLTVSGQILMGNNNLGAGGTGITVDGTLTQTAGEFGVGTAGGGGLENLIIDATGTVNANGAWLIAGFAGAADSGVISVNGGTLNVGAGMMGIGWAGTGVLDVNSGGTVVSSLINVGAAGGSGTITVDGSTIDAAGINNATGSLLLENGSIFTNSGGYDGGGTVTINDTSQFVFTVSELADVQALVLGNSLWNFSGTPSVTGSLGNVVVQNVPEPASLVLLGLGVCLTIGRRQRRA